MSISLPSDEVAEDYRTSLEDLISNDRYQISNLTLIAKENVEHAEAISRVLQNHITRAPPARKLPALYVLDSVVKNVGSPYNVYFGRNLYQTFMGAYSQVDEKVRRKLEEMLKTWREPVPGSLATTPVFPLSSTQNIVDNLNKLRAATGQPAQRFQQTSFPPPARATPVPAYDYQNTPEPPQSLPVRPPTSQHLPLTPMPVPQQYQQPQQPQQYQQPQQPQQAAYAQQWNQPQYPQYQHIQPTPIPQIPTPQPPSQPTPGHGVDLSRLHVDIDDLTTDAKIDCATHPMDQAAQKKLITLQTLKEILEAGTSSPSEVVDIRNSITQQMTKKQAERMQPNPVPPMPTQTPYAQQPPLQYPPPQQYPQYAPQPYSYAQSQQPQQAPTPALTTSLADLLRQHAGQTQTPPTAYAMPYSHPPVRSTPPVIHATPARAGPAEPPIIAALRAQGLLSAAPTPPQMLTPTTGSYASLAPPSMEVTFTSASIKIHRPHLVAQFLNARPNQCSTCGRRFTSDEQGREKKARHLDWHFKTRTRMMEAEKRGQNRSWYVDEREWIASREYDDDAPETMNGTSPAQKKKQEDFVRVPSDPALRNSSCPIDQEPFQSEWSEELQDFIWKDAMKVGNKYYHASCYREVTKDRDKDAGGATPMGAGMRTATPDSVLGKRKAEQDANGLKARIKTEA